MTTPKGYWQVEIDEIYIGLDRWGAHTILPVQAKNKKDRIGIVQIEQDLAVCATKFPNLICQPVAAQFMREDVIALFEFDPTQEGIKVVSEKHYKPVKPEDLSSDEIEMYRRHSIYMGPAYL